MQWYLVGISKFGRLIKNWCFIKNGYSLEEWINQNFEIIALID